jgi:hypothetical protein
MLSSRLCVCLLWPDLPLHCACLWSCAQAVAPEGGERFIAFGDSLESNYAVEQRLPLAEKLYVDAALWNRGASFLMACVQEKLMIYVGPILQESTEKCMRMDTDYKRLHTPLHALKAYRGNTDKAALVLKPCSRWKWVVNIKWIVECYSTFFRCVTWFTSP